MHLSRVALVVAFAALCALVGAEDALVPMQSPVDMEASTLQQPSHTSDSAFATAVAPPSLQFAEPSEATAGAGMRFAETSVQAQNPRARRQLTKLRRVLNNSHREHKHTINVVRVGMARIYRTLRREYPRALGRVRRAFASSKLSLAQAKVEKAAAAKGGPRFAVPAIKLLGKIRRSHARHRKSVWAVRVGMARIYATIRAEYAKTLFRVRRSFAIGKLHRKDAMKHLRRTSASVRRSWNKRVRKNRKALRRRSRRRLRRLSRKLRSKIGRKVNSEPAVKKARADAKAARKAARAARKAARKAKKQAKKLRKQARRAARRQRRRERKLAKWNKKAAKLKGAALAKLQAAITALNKKIQEWKTRVARLQAQAKAQRAQAKARRAAAKQARKAARNAKRAARKARKAVRKALRRARKMKRRLGRNGRKQSRKLRRKLRKRSRKLRRKLGKRSRKLRRRLRRQARKLRRKNRKIRRNRKKQNRRRNGGRKPRRAGARRSNNSAPRSRRR